MSSDAEQLVVSITAKIEEFAQNFAKASQTASDAYKSMGDAGKNASDRMTGDVKNATSSIGTSFEELAAKAEKTGIAIGVAIGGGILASVATMGNLIETLSKIGDRADDLRLSVNLLQALGVAAAEAGVPAEKLNSSLDHFTDVTKKNTDDAKDFFKALSNIGQGFVDSYKSATTQGERLAVVGNAYRSTTNEIKRAQLGQEAFGTENERTLSVVASGNAGLDAAAQKMRSYGLAIDEGAVKSAQQARGEFALLAKIVGDDLSNSFAGFLQYLAPVAAGLTSAATAARFFLDSFGADARKSTSSLEIELSTAQKSLDDLQAARARLSTGTTSTSETIRQKILGLLGEADNPAFNSNVAGIDTEIKAVQARMVQLNSLIASSKKSGSVTGGAGPAFQPRPKLSEDKGTDESTAFDRQTDSLNRHIAAMKADAIAVGMTDSAHQGLKAELALLQAAQRDDQGVTNEQIDAYTKLRATMSSQQALVASGIKLNEENAQSFTEVTKRVTEAAKTLDDAKQHFQGVNDALRFAGNELIDVFEKAQQKGQSFRTIMLSVIQAVEKQLLMAAITGDGAFAKMFGMASTTGGVGGIMGMFSKMFTGHAEGGLISGPGNGTSDSVVARVSNGEYIVRADATRRNLPLLHAINSGVPAFADGGLVGPRSIGAGGVVNNHVANVTLNTAGGGTGAANQDLADRVARSFNDSMRSMVMSEITTQGKPGGVLYR